PRSTSARARSSRSSSTAWSSWTRAWSGFRSGGRRRAVRATATAWPPARRSARASALGGGSRNDESAPRGGGPGRAGSMVCVGLRAGRAQRVEERGEVDARLERPSGADQVRLARDGHIEVGVPGDRAAQRRLDQAEAEAAAQLVVDPTPAVSVF